MNRDNCRIEILNIANNYKNSNRWIIDNLNGAIKTLSEDLYTKSSHFILELIQNAEDCKYSELPHVLFKLQNNDPTYTKDSNGALIIQYNEDGFLLENVEAICKVKGSTKNKSQGYIGEKGIGFKSVFNTTTCPYIISNGYSFSLPEIDEETGFGYVVPKWWDNPCEFENFEGTTIILPLNKEKYNYEKIELMLKEIESVTILFLSKIKKITIKTDSGDDFSIVKDDLKIPEVQLYIEGKKKGERFPHETRKFIYFNKKYIKPNEIEQENRKDIIEREVIVAYPLDHQKDVIGRVFAFLPTEFNTRFPFIINADFILTSGRSEIKGIDNKSDCLWNAWLWECIADCIANSLITLANKEILTVEFLNLLVSPLNQLESSNVLYPFLIKCKSAFIEQKLFKTDTGFSSAGEALILGSAPLLELFNDSIITNQLFERKHWLDKSIRSANTQFSSLYYFLRYKLNIPDIALNDFINKLDYKFLINQSDMWIEKFYFFLLNHGTNNTINIVKNKPIIRAIKDGKQVHVSPFNDNKPNVYISHDNNKTPSAIVKPEIIKNNAIEKYLIETLKIPIMNDISNIIDNIIPKYKLNTINITLDEHILDITRIAKAYKTGTSDEKNRFLSEIRDAKIILAENINNKFIGYKKPNEVYFKNDDLSIFFAFNETIGFVSSKYNESVYEFLTILGVENNIKIKRKQHDYQNHVIIMSNFGNHKRGINKFDPNILIDGLENNFNVFNKVDIVSLSKDKLILFSTYVWNEIAIKYSDCIRGDIEVSSNQNYNPHDTKKNIISDNFGRILIEFSWLPNKDGYFKKPSEMKLSELPKMFYKDEKLARQLKMKQDIVAQTAAKIGIQPEDLEFIRENSEAFKKWKEDTERQNNQASFPDKVSVNSELRKKRVREIADKENKRERVVRPRTVTYTGDEKLRARAYLISNYEDDEHQLRCQICGENKGNQKESPFQTLDGNWHFEAYPFLPSIRGKLHEANFLCLCHNHAAKFLLIDDEELIRVENYIINHDFSYERYIEINILGNIKPIWFTTDHINDLKVLLK